MYCIGNCYCWALILKLFYGGEIFTVDTEIGDKGREVRHFMLKDKHDRVRHFKRVLDFLPPPLCFCCFIGKLERSGKRDDK